MVSPELHDEDYEVYLELMAQFCKAHHVELWAYCLMPNHVHLIAVSQSADGLRRASGEAHRRYKRMVNFRADYLGSVHIVQPIRPLDLPVKVRSWELAVYPRTIWGQFILCSP